MNEKNQVFPNNFKTFRKKDIPKREKRNDSTEIIPKFELKPKAKDKKYYFRKAPSQKKIDNDYQTYLTTFKIDRSKIPIHLDTNEVTFTDNFLQEISKLTNEDSKLKIETNNNKKIFAFGVDVGQKSITFSGIDLRKPLTNPSPSATIGKKEILDFRDTGELANDIKEAISNDEFEKIGILQIQKYFLQQFRNRQLPDLILNKIARVVRQLQDIDNSENQSSTFSCDDFIFFIGDYTTNKGGNFSGQIINILKKFFDCRIINESYTSTIPCLCPHGLNIYGEITHFMEHAPVKHNGKSYLNWDSLQCSCCKKQANRDVIGSRNIALKGSMILLYNVHIFPTFVEKQNQEL